MTVIADDLTGAADCGISFTLAGVATFVATGGREPPSHPRVLSVDTDSRSIAPEEAVRRVTSAARLGGVLYKKIDSTLRGNVGVEIAAAAGSDGFVIASPAFPPTGRTMVGGEVLVSGVPLSETEIWRNSGMTGPSSLPQMLRAAGLRSSVIPLGAVRDSPARALRDAAASGARAVVCDAETDEDLARIAHAGAELRGRVVWAGSAGLARQLPAALRLVPDRSPKRPPLRTGPILALVGSRSGQSREQADVLAAQPGVFSLVVSPDLLLARRQESGELAQAIAAERDCVVAIDVSRELDLRRSLELAQALGEFAAPHVVRCGGVIATGGDTARALLSALDLPGIDLLGEVEPGVPLGLAGTLPLVTKAGAFGTTQALVRARAALRALGNPAPSGEHHA